jgi:rod shape-determining protein MreC
VLKPFFNKKTILYIIGIAALVLTFYFNPSFFASFKNISSKVLLFPEKLRIDLARYFRSKGELARENKILREKLASLSLELERYKDLKSEQERLRELLKFKEEQKFDTVSAEIVARNPNDWITSIFINRGKADGIEKNSAVCSAKGLLGKVVEVDSNASSVMLITHPGFKTGGIVRGSRVNGIVEGAGKGRVRMLYIPLDADVEKGAVVVTSGFSRIFPKGIGIGRIISVRKSKTGLYKWVEIEPFADPFDQEEVLCIK